MENLIKAIIAYQFKIYEYIRRYLESKERGRFKPMFPGNEDLINELLKFVSCIDEGKQAFFDVVGFMPEISSNEDLYLPEYPIEVMTNIINSNPLFLSHPTLQDPLWVYPQSIELSWDDDGYVYKARYDYKHLDSTFSKLFIERSTRKLMDRIIEVSKESKIHPIKF